MTRKRKPTHLHLADGTYRPDRHADEVDFGEADIQPFADMSKEAVHIWVREIGPLMEVGVLQQTDRLAFRLFCESVAEYEKAVQEIHDSAEIIAGKAGQPVKNPWLSIRNQAVIRIHQFGCEFGMTPSARARLIGNKNDTPKGWDLDA